MTHSAAEWALFSKQLVTGTVLAFAILVLLCAAVDPYDTGRLTPYPRLGTMNRDPRTAQVSRARNPSFRAAIIGNSNIALLPPARMTSRTGVPFASLVVPGSGPGEQLLLLDYFLRQRANEAQAVVIGLDQSWCTSEQQLPFLKPFPAWLYDPSPIAYLKGLVRYDALKRIPRRLAFLVGRARPSNPDGFWDYDAERVWRPETALPLLTRSAGSSDGNSTGVFPATAAVSSRLDGVLQGVAVVLVRVPVYVNELPLPGTAAEHNDASCREAFANLAQGRPNVRFVDLRHDTPTTREPTNFFDLTHYRTPVAREVENAVAEALRDIRSFERPKFEAAGGSG